MSSTKPEVYITYYSAAATGPSHSHMQHAEVFGKFGLVVHEVCVQTDRQTDMVTTILRPPTDSELMICCLQTGVEGVIINCRYDTEKRAPRRLQNDGT